MNSGVNISLKKYYIENILMDENFILKYLLFIINENDFENYLKTFDTKTYGNELGYYDFENKELKINYERLKNMKNLNDNNKNILILLTLYHELCHIFQNQLLNSKEAPIVISNFYRNLIAELAIERNDNLFYAKHYDDFLIEYHSEINSKIEVLNILKGIITNKEFIQNFNRWNAEYILNSYQKKSPIERSNDMIISFDPNIDIKIGSVLDFKYISALNNIGKENLTEIQKIKYGYPILDTTMYTIEDIASGKIKVLDLTKSI